MRKAAAVKASPAKILPSYAVEAYIASVPVPVRATLHRLREIIRSAAPPEASEVIAYGFPAFSLSKPFFGYAAFKDHISLFPFSGSFLDSFTEELKDYSRSKGTLHLPLDRPLPAALIRKLVRARVAGLSLKSPRKV